MSRGEPAEWTPLTPAESSQTRDAGHTSIFTRDEVERALSLLAPPQAAAEVLAALYDSPTSPGETFFHGDLLFALASLSPSAAERVRTVSTLTDAEIIAGIAALSTGPNPRNL